MDQMQTCPPNTQPPLASAVSEAERVLQLARELDDLAAQLFHRIIGVEPKQSDAHCGRLVGSAAEPCQRPLATNLQDLAQQSARHIISAMEALSRIA